jgi:histone H3/H4
MTEEDINAIDNDIIEAEEHVDEELAGEERTGSPLQFSPPFPLAKVKRLIKATSPNLNVSSEALSMITRACECFVETLGRSSAAVAAVSSRKTVLLKDMAEATRRDDRFLFCREFVPVPITFEEALTYQNSLSSGTKKL